MWKDDGMVFMKTFNKSEFSREEPKKKFKRILSTFCIFNLFISSNPNPRSCSYKPGIGGGGSGILVPYPPQLKHQLQSNSKINLTTYSHLP